MNHLAHFHLAAPEEDWLLGALLGDHVKGPLRGELRAGWEQGIALHRFIDARTDSAAELTRCSALLPPEFRRYRAILLDIYFDHCLGHHWQRFHPQPLSNFRHEVYHLLQRRAPELPAAAAHQIGWMTERDVLWAVKDWRWVEGALTSIGRRLRRDNPLHRGGQALAAAAPELEQVFLGFYPALIAEVQTYRRVLTAAR